LARVADLRLFVEEQARITQARLIDDHLRPKVKPLIGRLAGFPFDAERRRHSDHGGSESQYAHRTSRSSRP
jgi:hypothetical protein